MRRARLLWLVGLAACGAGGAPRSDAPPARTHFDAADVQTPAGSYDGYTVVRRCPIGAWAPIQVGVIGRGDACFYGVPCSDVRARVEASQRFREELRGQLGDAWSGDGFGARCTPGDRLSVHVSVHDAREIDDVIRRVGARLRADGLGEEVVITVEGDSVRY